MAHFKNIIPQRNKSDELEIVQIGHEKCRSAHTFGPYIRDNYLIHCCLGGCGVLYDKYGEHKVERGELFIIRPGEVTTYKADEENPWEYCWIGFRGRRAEVFSSDKSVYKCPIELFERLREVIENDANDAYIYLSVIYEMMYYLFFKNAESHDKLYEIKQYVKYNYMNEIEVSALAREYGFERSYLFRIFKKRYGKGIKEYITEVRMENAKSLLDRGYSVCDTAALIGYKNEFNFSRAFKQYNGISPINYKKQLTEGDKK